MVVIDDVISAADATELLIDLGTLWNALAKHAENRRYSNGLRFVDSETILIRNN